MQSPDPLAGFYKSTLLYHVEWQHFLGKVTEFVSFFNLELCLGCLFDLEKASPIIGCPGLVLMESTTDAAEELVDAPVHEERRFAICA